MGGLFWAWESMFWHWPIESSLPLFVVSHCCSCRTAGVQRSRTYHQTSPQVPLLEILFWSPRNSYGCALKSLCKHTISTPPNLQNECSEFRQWDNWSTTVVSAHLIILESMSRRNNLSIPLGSWSAWFNQRFRAISLTRCQNSRVKNQKLLYLFGSKPRIPDSKAEGSYTKYVWSTFIYKYGKN